VAATRVRLPDISPSAWEHPADRAALNALRRIPGFDLALRKIVGLFGERSIRLAFRANAVKVTPVQYPWLYEQVLEVCDTLDVSPIPDVYVSQTPLVNAGAVGLDRPFIVLNSSTLEIMDREHVKVVVAHEVGHIASGHAVYRTMLMILLRLTVTRYPLAGIAARPILYALLEWSRKAELSSDRAGLLAVQDPRVAMTTLMRIAGGARGEDLDLDEFIAQSEEYLTSSNVLDDVYKLLSMLGTTHPFAVARVAELRKWVDSGEYGRILEGQYRTRSSEPDAAYSQDVKDAAKGYSSAARDMFDGAAAQARQVADQLTEVWQAGRRPPNGQSRY